jgi:competence protein ComEC
MDGLKPHLPRIALGCLLGVCLLHLQPDIRLPLWTDASLLAALPLLLWLFYLKPSQRYLLAFFIGYLWALLAAHSYLQQRLDAQWQGEDLLITGQVSGLVDQGTRSVRFNFSVDDVRYQDEPVDGFKPQLLRLSWYHTHESIQPGQRWQLQVRLKPPHGMLNPGGFDYEKWLFQQGIHATGYVRRSESNRQLDGASWHIDGLRQQLIQQISAALDSPHQGLLHALSVGYKANMTPQHWQVMIDTGTSHLMAISGLHIGLVAGMVFFLARLLVPVWLLRFISKQQFAALLSLLAAGFYAALAGFAVPTQRAFVMLLVVLIALLLKRPAFSLNTLALALLAVLLLDPLAPLSAGFWLSFIAVLLIAVIIGGRVAQQGGWLQGLRLQWLIALSMLPISVLLFQQGSLVSPLANMLMIPLVGLLIVPMLLIASLLGAMPLIPLSTSLSTLLFNVAGQIMDLAWPVLEWLAQLPLASWQQASLPLSHSLPGLLGGLLLILPRGFPLKAAGWILLLPMLFYQAPRPQPGEIRLQLLDVGQGLSVLVQTRDHTLLYDAGVRRSERFDLGRLVIEPLLRHQGITSLDRLIISHADNDHAGGAEYLLQTIAVQQLMYGGRADDFAYELPPFAQNCKAGQYW